MTGRNVRLGLCFACAVAIAGASIAAQTPPRPPTPPRPAVEPAPQAPAVQPPQPPPPPRREPSSTNNVKVDVTITDQRGNAPAVKKTVSIITGDEMNGRIRTQAEYGPPLGGVPLNIDVMPSIRGSKIRLGVSLQYDLPVPPQPLPSADASRPVRSFGELMRTAIQENLNVNLDDGKPLVVAQSADPISDRQVTIELRATILK